MIVTVYTLFLVILSVYCLNQFRCSEMNIQSMEISVSDTTILKGIAILMVMIGHIGQAIPGARIFTPLELLVLASFFSVQGMALRRVILRMEESIIGTNG